MNVQIVGKAGSGKSYFKHRFCTPLHTVNELQKPDYSLMPSHIVFCSIDHVFGLKFFRYHKFRIFHLSFDGEYIFERECISPVRAICAFMEWQKEMDNEMKENENC